MGAVEASDALYDLPDFDAELDHGVLTLAAGARGTYVLNKQAPTAQIWVSSPVSGPARFNWRAEKGAWIDEQNGEALTARLAREWEGLAGEKVAVEDADDIKVD